jgi:recombination DNA repair RAD52 pathway protein
MGHTTRLSALAIAGILTLAACGGGDSNPTATPAAQASTTVVGSTVASTAATTSTTATGAPTTTAAAAPAAAKVPANTATRAELTAAFDAAGISNAARWAMEVEEYRPYPTNDPTFAKLRQNLAKYNPGPGVVDGIVATLSL